MLIVFLSAAAMGRLTVRSMADAAPMQCHAAPATAAGPALIDPATAGHPRPAAERHHNNRFHLHRHFGRGRASAAADQPPMTGDALTSGDASASAAGDQPRSR